jgi:branched-chain amino acid transport system ATP-binding protein
MIYMETVIKVENLTKDFGGLRALDQINLDVNKGEIVALIGPNGAGKTTFFNCITGMYSFTAGDIWISPPGGKLEKTNKLKPHKITEKGLARTFQNIRLFPNMTVLENVMIGRHCRMKSGILGAVLKNRTFIKEERQAAEESYVVLKKIGLTEYVNEFARNLPYGLQRKLEIARALATEPFILLLDEPAAGMNRQETEEMNRLIDQIRNEEKISVLLIEHDMKLVMSISDRIFVLDYGKKIAEGTPAQIRSNPLVVKAYLGEQADA